MGSRALGADDPRFVAFYEALAARHLQELTFPEVRRALQALSATYVEKRDKLARGGALDGAGKRAAFALFYGPLHLVIAQHIVRELGLADRPLSRITDLGCGTGVGGAAWALELGGAPQLHGVDSNRWALGEARFTYATLGLRGTTAVGDAARVKLHGEPGTGIVAAYTVNELDLAGQAALLAALSAAAGAGARVLVIEPIARRGRPWWGAWERAFLERGGRVDEWRLRAPLPEQLRLLDKAAGLSHQELTARTLALG